MATSAARSSAGLPKRVWVEPMTVAGQAPSQRRSGASGDPAPAAGEHSASRGPAASTRPVVALIGASRPEQLDENLAALSGPAFDTEELEQIDVIAAGIDQLWAPTA